jgi:hypothetical protein
MSHNKPGTPAWKQTNYTGKHELTPKEKAARKRMNIEYIFDTGDYFVKD